MLSKPGPSAPAARISMTNLACQLDKSIYGPLRKANPRESGERFGKGARRCPEAPRTGTGNGSSTSSQNRKWEAMNILHRQHKLVSVSRYYVGRFNLLLGIASLGAATAILALSSRKTGNQGHQLSLRLIPLILAGAFSFHLFRKPSQENPKGC